MRQSLIINKLGFRVKALWPQSMLFRTSFQKDFAQAAGATFVALFSIIITTVLVRTLGQAAGGTVGDSQVITLILLGGLQYLAPALVITVFIAVMGSISRSFKEQEMTAWFASGLSLQSLIRPVLVFSVPLTILALLCSIWLTPWSKAELNLAKDRFAKRSDVNKVSAGQFRESSDGKRVFFVERQNEDTHQVDNIFVVARDGTNRTVLAASGGSIEEGEDGLKYLIMKDGRRFGLDGTGTKFNSTEFESYGLVVRTNLESTPSLQLKNRNISELLVDPSKEAKAEILWRISLPLSGIVLAILAIPLAFVNPRGGQSLNQIFALLIYLTYSNVISVTQSSVAKGNMAFGLALVLPHLVVILLAFALMHKRNRPAGAPWLMRLLPGFMQFGRLAKAANSTSKTKPPRQGGV